MKSVSLRSCSAIIHPVIEMETKSVILILCRPVDLFTHIIEKKFVRSQPPPINAYLYTNTD